MQTTDPDALTAIASSGAASVAIRSVNHLTLGKTLPAPSVYDMLGNLKNVGHMMPQALEQLAAGLEKSLLEYEVTEVDGSDPTVNAAAAAALLREAARNAAAVGSLLERAQSAIAGQGYTSDS